MVGAFSSNARNPSLGSAIDKWLKRRPRHPASFECGVRVVDGELVGQRDRWKFRVSAIDQHGPPGLVLLHHGPEFTLTLAVDRDVPPVRGSRLNHVVLACIEVNARARVELSVPIEEMVRIVDDG